MWCVVYVFGFDMAMFKSISHDYVISSEQLSYQLYRKPQSPQFDICIAVVDNTCAIHFTFNL